MMLNKPMRIMSCLVGVYLASSGLAAQEAASSKASLPAADREWFGDDYLRAAEVLSSGSAALPRVSDERGAELVRRLTSPENFAFYRNKSLPLQNRMEEFFKMQQAVALILKQYAVAANKGENLHEETVRIMAFSLHVSVVCLELIDEFLPTMPKDDTYATRMDGLKKVKSGLTTQFVGAERSLSERGFYSAADFSLLLDAMASTLPKLKPCFPPGYPAELRGRLKTDRQAFTGEKDRKNIDRMLAELGS